MVTRPMTGCQDPTCPVLVPASGCWCWEHIRVCFDEPDCAHPAHICDDPSHYCPDHGGPE